MNEFSSFDMRRYEIVQSASYMHTDVQAEHAACSLNLRRCLCRGQSELTLSVAAFGPSARIVGATSVKVRCLNECPLAVELHMSRVQVVFVAREWEIHCGSKGFCCDVTGWFVRNM